VSQAGEKVFFDRSTLYAFRRAFAAGKTERAIDFLKRYTNRRLLGNHVPYPIEWGPEGTQPRLAAESALYCRVFTEGLFGIRPTGFRSFAITPSLPKAWGNMQLRNIHAFGCSFDLVVTRSGDKLQLETAVDGHARTSQVINIDLNARH
jgi:cellobiose phosphorylase